MILPSCLFYRIAHVPRSKLVYEVVECMEWKPVVRLRVHISLYNKNVTKTLVLKPYITEPIGELSVTVISVTKPVGNILNGRFAIARNEILAIPEQHKFPWNEQASSNFHQCENRVVCECDVTDEPVHCNCPKETIASIRADISNVLPISTPFMRIIGENESSALSTKEEMTISIESKIMKETAEYVVRQACKVSLGPIRGCYNCLEGATLNSFSATNTAFRSNVIHLIEPKQVILDFQKAIVDEECRVECNEQATKLKVHGTLAYMPHVHDSEILDSHEKSWTEPTSWFHDFNIPDLRPLLRAAADHWKAALLIFTATAIIGIATYFLGPTLILYLIQILFTSAELFAQLVLSLLHAACELIKKICQK
ncbi:hypothetical protein COOONC_24896 [Cooperia oncophora]